MRKVDGFVILLAIFALIGGMRLGFERLPEPKPKSAGTEFQASGNDFEATLRDAKKELDSIQRYSFQSIAVKETSGDGPVSSTWIYSSDAPSRIAVDWYFVKSYPEAAVQMLRNDVGRVVTWDRYLVVIRPIYGQVSDNELEQFGLRYASYFTSLDQKGGV